MVCNSFKNSASLRNTKSWILNGGHTFNKARAGLCQITILWVDPKFHRWSSAHKTGLFHLPTLAANSQTPPKSAHEGQRVAVETAERGEKLQNPPASLCNGNTIHLVMYYLDSHSLCSYKEALLFCHVPLMFPFCTARIEKKGSTNGENKPSKRHGTFIFVSLLIKHLSYHGK